MTLKVRILEEVDEKWNEQLTKSKFSSAFQTSNWIKNYKIPGSKPIFIQVETDEEKIVGQLAAIIHKNYLRNENIIAKKIGSKINISSILTWIYGPIVYDITNYSEIVYSILDTVEKIAKEKNIVMIKGSTPPMDQNESKELFKRYGYKMQPWSTYILSLNTDENNLYESLDKKTRYEIRKSCESNLIFEIPNGLDYPKEFYKLKNEEYQRDGRQISPICDSYEDRWENLFKTGIEKIFLAEIQDKVVSGISNIFFNGYIIQHAVANSFQRNSLAGAFVTWKTIIWAIKNKQKFYDMGGVNPNPSSQKEKNIDFYKSKWGGKKYSYSIYIKILDKRKQAISSILKNPKNVLKKIEKL